MGEAAVRPEARDPGVRGIPIELLEPNPYQPRATIRSEPLDELIQSVRRHGVLQPLLLRPHPSTAGRYQIVAGERRWRAAQAAGLHEIPAQVRPLSDTDTAAVAIVENLLREGLDPIEEAEGFSRMIREFGYTQDAVADVIGKSRSHVANTVRLLNLPIGIQMTVRSGHLSAGHARALVGHPAADVLAQRVIADGLSVRQTEALVAHHDKVPNKAETPPHNPDIAALERSLSEQLGLRVSVNVSGKGGTLRIHYSDLDQLDGLLVRLQGV
ncbi:MAG TPA: ParB/RepB/Spo0J family partition protein [Acetobacteraceae bacterium]|nr:ParB/RepB/Spo0J family partition protein [Acetobacteraceae bacterium]